MQLFHAISNNAPEADFVYFLYAATLVLAFVLSFGGMALSSAIYALRRHWRQKHGIARTVRLLPHRRHLAVL